MLKYLIIQLDDTSVSYCHNSSKAVRKLMSIESLKKAIVWAMKENLTVQIIYPNYAIPNEYHQILSEVDHADIVSSLCEDEDLRNMADVVVFETIANMKGYPFTTDVSYVIRITVKDFIDGGELLKTFLPKLNRLNVVFTDVTNFNENIQLDYSIVLELLAEEVKREYAKEHFVQINLLTDRIFLDSMNNCSAGEETITLAPNAKFYICPAFYSECPENSVGDITNGLDVKNPQLYRLDHAPICSICDAFQCKRCVWLNRKMTLEVNTPSHEQCVMAHIERNASRKLLAKIREIGTFLPDKDIPEITYLDPFDKLQEK